MGHCQGVDSGDWRATQFAPRGRRRNAVVRTGVRRRHPLETISDEISGALFGWYADVPLRIDQAKLLAVFISNRIEAKH